MIKKIAIVFGLMLMGLSGVKGDLAQAYSVDSSGSGLVSNVLAFRAIPGDKHVALSWVNPKTGNFTEVVIVRSDQSYLAKYDGTEGVYRGAESSYIDLELTNDKKYFYTIFAHSSTTGTYSSGSIAQATPKLPSLESPYAAGSKEFLDAGQALPSQPAKKTDKIELTDFYYYLILNQKVLQIGLNSLSELHVAGDSVILIEIPSDIFSKPLNVISVSTDESSYLMTEVPDKNKYQLVISASKNAGQGELRFVAVFKDKTISDVKTKLAVDPRGYIYQEGSNFLGFGPREQMRIEGGEVTIYQKEGGEWKVWESEKYFQKNPQKTDSSGEYTFFVPKGEYYLEVKKTGSKTYTSEPFLIDGEMLNKNIGLAPWVDTRLYVIIPLLLLVLFLIFRWLKKRSHQSGLR